MAKRYQISTVDHAVEMSKPNSTILIYKFRYKDIETKRLGFIIQNPFIVYILYGHDASGNHVIYVGKSKNGVERRPGSHKDKFENWSDCYVLTQYTERTFFNDGTIQYLENELNNRVNEIGTFTNTTKQTTAGTANKSDEDACDEYLDEAYAMLQILGLDLISNSEDDLAEKELEDPRKVAEDRKKVPNGIYFFERMIKRLNNLVLKGTMEVKDGKFILKAGSTISPDIREERFANIEKARLEAVVEDGILRKDVVMDSPSACACFIIGAACNGWKHWKTADGRSIDIYRRS